MLFISTDGHTQLNLHVFVLQPSLPNVFLFYMYQFQIDLYPANIENCIQYLTIMVCISEKNNLSLSLREYLYKKLSYLEIFPLP